MISSVLKESILTRQFAMNICIKIINIETYMMVWNNIWVLRFTRIGWNWYNIRLIKALLTQHLSYWNIFCLERYNHMMSRYKQLFQEGPSPEAKPFKVNLCGFSIHMFLTGSTWFELLQQLSTERISIKTEVSVTAVAVTKKWSTAIIINKATSEDVKIGKMAGHLTFKRKSSKSDLQLDT